MRVVDRPSVPLTDKTAPIQSVNAVSQRQAASFEAVLRKREVRARQALRGQASEADAASSVSPELFGNGRSLEILERVLEQILPALDFEPQVREMAEDFIREEIETRQQLEQQRAEVQVS
ncbi:hypothetical protein ACW9IK_00695 [Pseudomonas gingeri]|uniref:hypothetical protein n=1 Tax=Pseudomonas TaxID=286 RepID=UPI0015A224DE|nr:hypothetical protein [Pseudomonas gingeri]NVZ66961.1 hypothetical protein [Pseudomonas gingeri]NVZ79923.1 hypothetical protein [Pseudomonas gingeri]